MPARARAEYYPPTMEVRIAVTRILGSDSVASQIFRWTQPTIVDVTAQELESREPSDGGGWLYLDEEAARAIYEALADHFGHTGHDMRTLRRDFEHERGRVDKVLGMLVDKVRAI